MNKMYTKRILIVDDEPKTRTGLKKTLEKWSEGTMEIRSASNASEAIEILTHDRYHLLITDIRMPEITGLRLLEVLRKQGAEPMVIVISAYSEFAYAQEALRLGVVNYLLKPISKTKLIEAVKEALEKEEKQTKSGLMEKILDSKLINVNRKERYSGPIKEAMDYIEANFRAELTLKEVAKHVHLNPSYLSTLFKEEIQLSFSEYVTRMRLQQAKNLLLTTNLTITDIAEQVGYHTTKYFIKVFKEQENMTPNAYRKLNENAF